ncbi:MAG TPA: response regulator [Terriglobales bacterium]|nr:response regulator [Terriglobales bacterium]
MRALIVDDSSTMRSVLRMTLRGAGFETVEAGNGVEAVQRLTETGPVDLALVDWNMPRMNGFEFLCTVRANHDRDQMKIVMVTTETELSQVENALRCGANEYLMKPFTRDSVIEKLQILGLVGATA